MSVWYTIKDPEDVDISLDGEFLDVLFSTDDFGNNYIEITIKFVEHCLIEHCLDEKKDKNPPNTAKK